MTNEAQRPEESRNEDEAKTEASSAGTSKIGSFFAKTTQYWLALLLITTLVIHGLGWAWYKAGNAAPAVERSPEIGIGTFKFTADKTSGSHVAGAEFAVYITALDGLDGVARNRLSSHQFRVQEEIESMLRQAHSGDFVDPALNDIKRQIRERIDQALKNRVVSDVIITNLKFSPSDAKEPAQAADSASSPPWLQKASDFVSQ